MTTRCTTKLKTRRHISNMQEDNKQQTVGRAPVAKPTGGDLESRIESRGAYQVISPNEKKRQDIQEKAQKETEAYEKYKQDKKPSYVSFVGTAGGSVPENDVRMKTQQDVLRAKVTKLKKAEKWKQEKKLKEDLELNKMKQSQRQKTEKNEESQRLKEERLKDEHRRHNLEFFEKKFGAQSKQESKSDSKVHTHSAASPGKTLPVHDQQESESASVAVLEHTERLSVVTNDNYYDSGIQYEHNESLVQLKTLYPDQDTDFLKDLLNDVNGSVDTIVDLLS